MLFRFALAAGLSVIGLSSALAVTIPPADQRSSVTIQSSGFTTVTVPIKSPDYIALFDEFDNSLNEGQALSMADNANGQLAWLQSYHMMAYMRAWRATGDTKYLDKVAEQFARVLECRDDHLDRKDVRTGTARKGWGTATYDKTGWHVFVVHTGMISLGPAEFVREVQSSATLQQTYGTTASLFLTELEAMVEEANADFVVNQSGEGWYEDPNTSGIVPLNMSNAMGSVIVELYGITGKTAYRDQATTLATYFRHCLRDNGSGGWNWSYWARTSADKVGRGEDISHAAINVDFAGRCKDAGIVFTALDMKKFGQTWLHRVRRSNGTWSGFVDGERAPEPDAYIPQAAGRWLSLMPHLPYHDAELFYSDVARAFAAREITVPSRCIGITGLALYGGKK